MKKMNLVLACFVLLTFVTACNDSGTSTTTTTTTDNTTSQTGDTSTTNNTAATTPTNTTSNLPLNKEDSTFVTKAAMGSLMEIQAGTLAQQKATNDRVKSFAAMMVNDHTKASNELTSLVSGRGMMLSTTLPPDMQKHMDAMQKMSGKAFDKHYMDMMVNDHKKTVADFEKQANSGSDTDLKAWAGRTLPTLQMHRDSAVAISKMKM